MKHIWLLFVGVVVIFGTGARSAQAQDTKDVKLDVVKFDGLSKEVSKYKGKVVVVDFWSNTCPPCIKAFPKMAKLQRKYGGKGLQIITVSTSKATKEELTTAKSWLAKFEMPTRNLLLDEDAKFLAKELRITSVPSIYVFNRQGKWRHFVKGVSAEELEKLIVEFLNEK